MHVRRPSFVSVITRREQCESGSERSTRGRPPDYLCQAAFSSAVITADPFKRPSAARQRSQAVVDILKTFKIIPEMSSVFSKITSSKGKRGQQAEPLLKRAGDAEGSCTEGERVESLKNAIVLWEQTACPSWLCWQGEEEDEGVRPSGENTPVGWDNMRISLLNLKNKVLQSTTEDLCSVNNQVKYC